MAEKSALQLFSVFAACFRVSFSTIGDVTVDTLIQVTVSSYHSLTERLHIDSAYLQGIYPTIIITLASTLPALVFTNFEYAITTYIHGVFGEPEDGMSGASSRI